MTVYPILKTAAAAGFALLLAASVQPQPSVSNELAAAPAPAVRGHVPEAPRSTVAVTDLPPAGRTVHVAAGGNLQEAIDKAAGGDLILLDPGATYEGPFRLPNADHDGWVVIASAAIAHGLPAAGHRVDPSLARLMPKLQASSGPVIEAEPRAHYYRLVGLEIAPAANTFLREVVRFGGDATQADAQPHHLVIDRCYVHGDAARGSRRGIALNGRDMAVVDSHVSDFKEAGADSQAIAGWNGAGPFRIANNYLEGAGENVMFGGADPTIPDLVPSDIEVLHNHLAKPLAWKVDESRREGAWTVKNLFELKNARRVVIDGNLLEYNWPHGQNGFAILFTPRNQDGKAPWSTVEDVVFSNNLVRHVAAGINMLGHDDNYPSGRASRIAIQNNLFEDVGGKWGNGRLFQLLDGMADVTIDHNTAFQTDSIVFGGDHAPHTGFVFQNNIVLANDRGIVASGTTPGTPTLNQYFPRAVVRRNILVGGEAGQYPPDNFFPDSLATMGFVPQPSGDLRLVVARPFARAATDGRDPGADVQALGRAMRVTTPIKVQYEGRPAIKAAFIGAEVGPAALALFAVRPEARSLMLQTPSAEATFWLAALLLVYIYVGYPVVARLRALVKPHARVTAPLEPHVSIVVIAYNEAERIEAKIQNLLALDYPADRLEILVGSDGSTDDTVACARRYESERVKVHAFHRRRGKPAVINALVPRTRGEIVVFADARQRFEPGAVRALVSNFADPSAGVVSGCLVLEERGAAAAGHGSAFYWRYERLIRATESRSGSCVGATGAIYAMRRELFEPIPEDTILDDVVVPIRAVRRGYRILFEPNAKAYDSTSTTAVQEFTRKTRTIAGTFQLFAREPWLLNPARNPLWFETVSHKGLRLTLPLMHAALLAATVLLVGSGWLYQFAGAGQAVFYAAAAAGWTRRHAQRRMMALTLPYTICLLCWATVVGCARFLAKRQQVTWERVPAHPQPVHLAWASASQVHRPRVALAREWWAKVRPQTKVHP